VFKGLEFQSKGVQGLWFLKLGVFKGEGFMG